MNRDESVIAKRLIAYFDSEDEFHEQQSQEPKQPGFWTNVLIVLLMSVALMTTRISLKLTRWIKALEA